MAAALFFPVNLRAAESAESVVRGFGFADWAVLFVYAVVLVGIGFYYSRRQSTSEEYFVAGRNLAPFLAGVSLYATMFSTLSYIGNPGETAQNGPVLLCLNLVSLPAIYLIVGYLIIPPIMRLQVTSAYELLETRLGRPIRLMGSGIFIVIRLLWMALMLYTTALVLVTVLSWDTRWLMPIMICTGVVTTVYTLYGGIKAVVITDVLQFFVLLLGAIITVVFVTMLMGGVGAWWPEKWADHWAPQPFFSLDPGVRVTMVGTFVGNIIWWVTTSGSDQMAIQRYLSTRDAAAARRAFLHNSIAGASVTVILGLVGLAVLGFFRANPSSLPAALSLSKNGDALFPHFVSHILPVGLRGVLVAGMLAAAMSSVSSGISSIITVLSKDFMATFWPHSQRSDASRLKMAHILAAVVGMVIIAGSQLANIVPGNLIEVCGKTINLFICPMFGLFFLALFVPFATPFGALLGAIYSMAAAILVAYWDVITGGARISFQWISPIAFVTSIVFSCLFSLLPTRGKSAAILAGYTLAALVPWIVLLLAVRP